jgi:hypothetical protein
MRLFGGKLPTKRWAFCEIVRNVTIEHDLSGVYSDGCYGYIVVDSKKVYVVNNGGDLFELYN